VKLLLDTHALLWFLANDSKLSATAKIAMNQTVRLATLIVPLFFWLSADACGAPLTGVESLAEIIQPMLPEGWKLSLNDGQVILERAEMIGVYNGLGLPAFHSDDEMRAYVKRIVRYKKLTISLWLGKRIDAEAFNRMKATNSEAVSRARKDRDNLRFIPDDEFWLKHPQYGYVELPILDTGTNSVYMKCEPLGAILRPTKTKRPGGRIMAFWDKKVEGECQGIVDELGKIFSPY
jgi:hypothetical protein